MIHKSILILAGAILSVAACDQANQQSNLNEILVADDVSIIPLPQTLEANTEKAFKVTPKWAVTGHAKTSAAFHDLMVRTSDIHFEGSVDKSITFTIDPTLQGAESYILEAGSDGIRISAPDDAGLFYGAVSLWQLLVPAMQDGAAIIPTVNIIDKPRFGWRGLMLDEGRHFQGLDFVKKFIDWMSLHKFNVFQWHLVDDQGWRIEIKQYPDLTAFGAWRVPAGDGPKKDIDPKTGEPRKIGGFYTQAEIREVVAYAKARHITVVPEIGLPGHAQAAIASYPHLGVNTSSMPVTADWGIFEYTYNLEPETFTVLENILLEVMDLFPSEYIHLGGDEVQKKQWQADTRTRVRMQELGIKTVEGIQPYFTRHFDAFLASHGRKMIGWDEILEGGKINTTATVMSWRGEKGGIDAAHKGHSVVMSPWPVMYMDMHQSVSGREPTGRPARSSLGLLKNVYEYEPVPKALQEKGHELILGAQANIWTEHMRSNDHVMHMTFPRAAAISEALWSPRDKNFSRFVKRLPQQFLRYKKLGIKYADVAFEAVPDTTVKGRERSVQLRNQVGEGDIHYTLDGSAVSLASPIYTAPLNLYDENTLTASTFMGGVMMSAPTIQKMDKSSLSVRSGDMLEVCEPGYHLKLDDDAPRTTDRAALAMNILDPCWIYRQANIVGVKTIEIDVGQVPFNFQIGDDWQKVRFDTPKSQYGELNIYENICDGTPINSISLEPARGNDGITTVQTPLTIQVDVIDLCFRFALPPISNKGAGHNLWGIHKITLK